MKKLLALFVAVVMLCISLTSCSTIGDFIEDIVEDIIEDKADEAMKDLENSIDTDDLPNTLNGMNVKTVYMNAQELVLGMSQYYISGEHDLQLMANGAIETTETKFESRVSGSSAHVKNTVGSTPIDYYFADNTAYMCLGTNVQEKVTDAELSEFVDEVGSNINTGTSGAGDPGNWIEYSYIDFSDKYFTENSNGDYVLSIKMTKEQATAYYSQKGFSGIASVDLDYTQIYDSLGNLKKYSYDVEIVHTVDGTQCVYDSEWIIEIHETGTIDEITLPTWLGGGSGNSGNGGGSSGGGSGVGGTVNEEEDPNTIAYHEGVKYYAGTNPKVGDMNNDGKVTYFDVWMQIDQEFDEYDWDENGVITYNDIVESGKSASVIQSTISQYVERYNEQNS